MILLVPLAAAGLIDALDAESRQVEICKQAAAPMEEAADYGRAADVWDACLGEARRLGHAGIVPMLEDEVALLRARAAAAPLRTTDPHAYGLAVLTVAAVQRSDEYPGTDVADVFRAWMTTEAGKGRLEPARTLTLQWDAAPADAALARRAAEVFRRDVEDLGLKWAEPGSPDVDVIVFAGLRVGEAAAPEGEGAGLAHAEARFEATRVRFRTLDRTAAGFTTVGTAEEAEYVAAEDQALRAACERAAQRILKQVLRIVLA